jgi:hypothetical protein
LLLLIWNKTEMIKTLIWRRDSQNNDTQYNKENATLSITWYNVECHYASCHFAVRVIILGVTNAEWLNDEDHFAECRSAKCRSDFSAPKVLIFVKFGQQWQNTLKFTKFLTGFYFFAFHKKNWTKTF